MNALTVPAPYVTGYREAAQYAIEHISVGGRIAFSGNRDGAFIINVRELDAARTQTVVRVDKLLFRIEILKEVGVSEIIGGLAADAMTDLLVHAGIEIIVVEPDEPDWPGARSSRSDGPRPGPGRSRHESVHK